MATPCRRHNWVFTFGCRLGRVANGKAHLQRQVQRHALQGQPAVQRLLQAQEVDHTLQNGTWRGKRTVERWERRQWGPLARPWWDAGGNGEAGVGQLWWAGCSTHATPCCTIYGNLNCSERGIASGKVGMPVGRCSQDEPTWASGSVAYSPTRGQQSGVASGPWSLGSPCRGKSARKPEPSRITHPTASTAITLALRQP